MIPVDLIGPDRWSGAFGSGGRLAIAFGLAILLALMLPTVNGAEVFPFEIEITASGASNPASHGSEVWLNAFEVGGENRAAALFSPDRDWPDQDWEVRGEVVASYRHQPARLKWHGWLPRGASLSFAKHAWAGMVNLKINGQERNFDLYAPSSATKSVALEPFISGAGQFDLSFMWFFVCVMVATPAFHWGLGRLAQRLGAPPRAPDPGRAAWPWWAFGLPTLLASLVFLVGFWPGQMSPDSYDQWRQILSGNYSNHHPVAHTFFMALITFVWRSPAGVVLVQIAALSTVIALFIDEARAWGVGERACRVVAVILPLMAVNELMATVLWKDVLYSAGMAYLLVAALSFLRLGPDQARKPGWLAGLLAAGLAVTLFRHNGLVVGPVLPLALALLAWKTSGVRWRLIMVATALVLSYAGVNKLLVPALGIPNIPIAVQIPQEMHVLGGMTAAGVPMSEQDRRTIGSMFPLEAWQSRYDCGDFSAIFHDPQFNRKFVNDHPDLIHELTARLIIRHPDVFLRHQLCASTPLWRIIPAPKERMSGMPLGIEKSPLTAALDLHFNPPSEALRAALVTIFSWSRGPFDFMWRPGLFLFIALATVVSLAYGRKDYRLLVLLAPTLANTLPYFWLMCTPDYRYQFGVVLSGELLPLLLLALPYASGTTSARSASGGAIRRSLSLIGLAPSRPGR